MHQSQRAILFIGLFVILGMTLYPPFHGTWQGNELNLGYNLIFNPPNPKIAFISAGTLIAQYFFVCIVTAVAWVLKKP